MVLITIAVSRGPLPFIQSRSTPASAGLVPNWLQLSPPVQAAVDRPSSESRRAPGLARDLSQVISEPIFSISWLVEAARHQLLDSILSGGSSERGDARIPPGAKLN